jgi:hypothetical protein
VTRDRIIISKLVKTCDACPSQWDGWTAEGDYYYFRYRFGRLRVSRQPLEESILEKNIGHTYDGEMTTLEMMANTSEKFAYDI